MQKNCDASPGCPKSETSPGCAQSKAYPYKLQENGVRVAGFPKHKDEISTHSGGGSVEPTSSLSTESFGPPNEGYYRPTYQEDFCMWSNFHPEFHNMQQNQWNGLESFNLMNHENQIAMANRIQYVPFRMFSQNCLQEFQFQEFQYFVVIDFEATCDKEKNPHPQEIIEFPSVLVNSLTGQLEASFQTYVRPIYHQNLSDFCKELTGIQQIQVDRGVSLSEALLMHDKWLEDKGIKNTKFAVVTWSNWDCRVMLESECRFKRIRKPPYFNRWINLKVPFHEVFRGARCNLKEAVQLAGLAWEGRAHCGLDDARNTARLLAYLMRRGFRFSITNQLMWHTAERPLVCQQPVDRQLFSNHYPHPLKQPHMPVIQFYPARTDPSKERRTFCRCGLRSSKGMMHGSLFFGCGNWSSARGVMPTCDFFEWAS